MSKRRSGLTAKQSSSSTSPYCASAAKVKADVMNIEDEDDGIPSTQPVDERVLKDVIAYVEVRSNTENRSRSVSKQLELLGAVVVTKFSPEVTHVIWKEGKQSVKDKAIKKGLHLVSVLWVDSCKQNQEHVAESLFPIHNPADGSPLVMAKLKRIKSMQPKALEEDLQNGTFKKRRKRKRKLCADDFEPRYLQNASPSVMPLSFQTASPIVHRPRVLVEDTQQPLSPLRRIVGPDLTPTISLIPNTPDSMRRALDSLSRRKMGTPTSTIFTSAEDSSPTTKPATPMQSKKLFTSSAASGTSDTDSTITGSSRFPAAHSSHNTTDSSDSEKEQQPAKRQKRSSGEKEQRKSAEKSRGKVSFEESSQTETDGVNEAVGNGKYKGSRVSELSKVKKGRRSSGRLQRQSGESKEESVDSTDNQNLSVEGANEAVSRDKTKGRRVSELSKVKKGRRSSGRLQRRNSESKEESGRTDNQKLNVEDTNEAVSKVQIKDTRVSELSNVTKRRRSSGRIQRQSAESREELVDSTDDQKLNEEYANEAVTNDKIKGKRVSELSKVNKGRRSSGRLQRQSGESKEESVDSTDNQNLSVGDANLVSNRSRASERNSDTNVRPQRRKSMAKVQNENTVVRPKSATSDTLHLNGNNTKEPAPENDGQSSDTSASTTTKKRRRKLMSTQCKPSEELIVPSQSTTKSTQSILGNDSLLFPGLRGEDEENGGVSQRKKKGSTGRLTSVSSSRKRKKLISSSESENEPPEGSQELTSSQSSNITLIPTSRKSLEEFKPQTSTRKKTRPASQAKPKRRKTSALREVNNSTSTGSDGEMDVSDVSVSSRKSSRQTSSKGRNGSTLETSLESDDSTLDTTKPKKRIRIAASQSVRKSKKGKPTLVMTSMHAKDQELVLSVAKSLKHFKVIHTVCDSTTHVVCGDHRRTLNVLSGIARGCWLLSMEWVLDSVEAGHWLPEEPYEIHDIFPAAQMSRLERVAAGDAYKQDLFAPPGSIYITDESAPPKERLVELVELCGGQVAYKLSDATLCVGNVKTKKVDVPVVAELWVLDCITQHCQLPLEPYFMTD